MYRLAAFNSRSKRLCYWRYLQRVEKSFCTCCEEWLFEFRKKALQSGVQDVKVAIKRRAAEGVKKMAKKSISRAPTRKTGGRKQTITGKRLTATKKKRVSADLL